MTTQNRTPDGLSELSELLSDDEGFSGSIAELEPEGRRTGRRVGLIIALIVVAALIAVPAGYIGWALTAPVSAPAVTSQTPDVPVLAAASLALPSEGASAISVSGADEYLGAGGLWATSGTDEARPIASISKVITALVVLDAKPLASADDPGPTLTFDGADNDLYDKYYVLGATVRTMPTGSSMSQRDALGMMLIPSASNYADAVATWAFGSQSGFVSATRRWLAANGLTGTTIVEPTGIDSRNKSTPNDLVAIGKLAAANPTIARLAGTSSASLGTPGHVTNTNGLLGVDGITGLKTGNLGEDNYALLYTASIDVGASQPLSVTGVSLGGHSRETVDFGVLALLDSIRDGFHRVPLVTEGQEVGSYTTPWGSTARMVIGESASIFTWSDTPITVTMDTTTPTTYRDGEVVGSITWTAGPNSTTAPVLVEGNIAPPTEWWRLTHPGELGAE